MYFEIFIYKLTTREAGISKTLRNPIAQLNFGLSNCGTHVVLRQSSIPQIAEPGSAIAEPGSVIAEPGSALLNSIQTLCRTGFRNLLSAVQVHSTCSRFVRAVGWVQCVV